MLSNHHECFRCGLRTGKVRLTMKRRWSLALLAALGGILFLSYDADIDVEDLTARYAYPDSDFVMVGDTKVHYRATGDPSSPTLVLIHGVASSLHTWEGWHDRLSDAFHIISFDVPPFGLTGAIPGSPYEIQAFVAFLDQLFEALQLEQIHLAGNSFGGLLAWRYALAHPERIDKLILVDAEGLSVDTDNHVTQNNLGFRIATTPVLKYVSHVSTPGIIFRKSIEAVYGDPSQVTDAVVTRYRDLMLRTGNRAAFSDTMTMITKLGAGRDQISKLTQPTLILWGEKDQTLPVSAAHLFHELLPGSTLKVYPELGHVPMEEDPTRTAADVKAFLLDNLSKTQAAGPADSLAKSETEVLTFDSVLCDEDLSLDQRLRALQNLGPGALRSPTAQSPAS
jgi:pimeloyl-ACP methyl ester carboxylesterase